MESTAIPQEFEAYWKQLDCGFPRVQPIFADCMRAAFVVLDNAGMMAYLDSARFLGKMGRGAEPILIFLEEWPVVASILGANSLPLVMDVVRKMWKSPNSTAITPFLQSLPTTARRLHSIEQLRAYLDIVLDFMERTTGSVHGIHQTFPSPSLPVFFKQTPVLFSQLALSGLKNWIEYGIRNYAHHPERQIDYFSLQSADSRAVLQRERHGTLLVDADRKLSLYLRALWQDEAMLIPYSTGMDETHRATPYYDALGIRLPDVYGDFAVPSTIGGELVEPHNPSTSSGQTVLGIDRYRAALAHLAGHRRWTRPIFADNLSPFQRMAAECLEDSRVECLAIREYAGLLRIFLALHPKPAEDACDPKLKSGCAIA